MSVVVANALQEIKTGLAGPEKIVELGGADVLQMTDKLLAEISTKIPPTSLTFDGELKMYDFEGTKKTPFVPGEGFKLFLSKFPKITSLYLSETKGGDAVAEAVFELQNLKTLELEDVRMDKDEYTILVNTAAELPLIASIKIKWDAGSREEKALVEEMQKKADGLLALKKPAASAPIQTVPADSVKQTPTMIRPLVPGAVVNPPSISAASFWARLQRLGLAW